MVEAVASEEQPVQPNAEVTAESAPEEQVPPKIEKKMGTIKMNVLEAYTKEKYDPEVTPCYLLIETVSQRFRTQTTADGDCTRERTWATEIIELAKFADQDEVRICLVKLPNPGSSDSHAEVLGNCIIDLDTFTKEKMTQRWFELDQGTYGAERKIGHLRIRTVWKQMPDEPFMHEKPPPQPIKFIDGT